MYKNEHGYSMLVVLLAMVLFSVLGLGIMGMSLNTAKMTEVRETDVQYIHLAEKELDRLVAEVYAKFDGFIVEVDPDKITQYIESQLNYIKDKLDPDANSPIAIDGDPCGTVLIPRIPDEFTQPDSNSWEIGLQVIVKPTITNSEVCAQISRTLEQTIILTRIPDVLKYTVGTEGKLTINGAPYIIGDIFAGNNMEISNKAKYLWPGIEDHFLLTNYPIARGTGRLNEGNINKQNNRTNLFIHQCPVGTCSEYADYKDGNLRVTGDGIHAINLSIDEDNQLNYKNKIVPASNIGFNPASLEAYGLTSADNLAPIYRGRAPFGKLEEISELYETFAGESMANLQSWKNSYTDSYVLGTLPAPDPIIGMKAFNVVEKTPDEEEEDSEVELENLEIPLLESPSSPLLGKYFYTGAGSLTIDKSLTGTGTNTWLIIHDEDLYIEGPEIDSPEDYLTIEDVNFLVYGNLRISGKVKLNSAIYVYQDENRDNWVTEIADAKLQGIAEKALALFSTPHIKITRVNVKDEVVGIDLEYPEKVVDTDPRWENVIKGFFYTEGAEATGGIDASGNRIIERTSILYGVGSRLWIKGGFFSKRDLELNAYRGNTEVLVDGIRALSSETNANQRESRLIIEYDWSSIEKHLADNTILNASAYISVKIDPRKLIKTPDELGL